MTKIDIFSGFLGAGKTTLIKKLLKEAYKGEQVVLGGNSRYTAMCRKCWLKRKAEQEAKGIF